MSTYTYNIVVNLIRNDRNLVFLTDFDDIDHMFSRPHRSTRIRRVIDDHSTRTRINLRRQMIQIHFPVLIGLNTSTNQIRSRQNQPIKIILKKVYIQKKTYIYFSKKCTKTVSASTNQNLSRQKSRHMRIPRLSTQCQQCYKITTRLNFRLLLEDQDEVFNVISAVCCDPGWTARSGVHLHIWIQIWTSTKLNSVIHGLYCKRFAYMVI